MRVQLSMKGDTFPTLAVIFCTPFIDCISDDMIVLCSCCYSIFLITRCRKCAFDVKFLLNLSMKKHLLKMICPQRLDQNLTIGGQLTSMFLFSVSFTKPSVSDIIIYIHWYLQVQTLHQYPLFTAIKSICPHEFYI